jgi:hypothetical protein
VHADRDAHETPNRTLDLACAGFGVRSIDQLMPFQRSASVTVMPDLFVKSPTDVHKDAEEQEIQRRWPVRIAGFGVGTVDQRAPEFPEPANKPAVGWCPQSESLTSAGTAEAASAEGKGLGPSAINPALTAPP